MTPAEQQLVFQDWLERYRAIIFKIVRSYASTATDQDDLFQEIVIQVWRSVPAFRQASSVPTWLYRVSLNTAIKWTKKERKHTVLENIDQRLLQAPASEMDERLTWLYDAIHRLDKVDRSVALLLLEGFSYKEMAAILGITESNVGVKINRIKKRLINQSKQGGCYGI